MMLDEIDKMGSGIQGDPASAMLEVLDPEQNNSFRDNYLAVPFDLSRVVFIATANQMDTIPGPLRDRMEVISLAGYTAGEKLQIAERYLVRRQLDANGLKVMARRRSTRPQSRDIIKGYTREAGVRLAGARDRPRAAPCRRRDRRGQRDQGRDRPGAGGGDPGPALAPPENEVAMRTATPGVATGLAWTPVGGDILFHRGGPHARQWPADPRPGSVGRRDEGKRPGRAQPGQGPRRRASTSIPTCSRRATSTSTSRPARRPRTGRRRGWRCTWR